MPRVAAPRLWKDRYFVTEAGGRGIKILCRKEEGLKKAREELEKWLDTCRKERKERAKPA